MLSENFVIFLELLKFVACDVVCW